MPDIVSFNQQPEKQIEEQPTVVQKQQPMPQQNQQHAMNFFSTFIQRPAGIGFVQQQAGEDVLLFLRRHFIRNLPWIIITIILLLLPLGLPFVLQFFHIPSTILPPRFGLMLLFFYYVIVLGFAFSNFVSWFYNIGLITTKRVLDIDFTDLSSIHVAGTVISEVEDVSYQQNGFFASLFDYGTVEATTIASKDNFVFDHVPHPVQVVNLLSPMIGERQ